MDVLTNLKRNIRLLGIKENGNFGKLLRIYIVILIVMVINISCFLIEKWNKMDSRITALKAITLLITFGIHLTSFSWYWNEFLAMLDIFSDIYYQVPYSVSPNRKKIIHLLETKIKKCYVSWSTMIVAYLAGAIIMPMLMVAIKVAVFSRNFQDVITENQSAPFPLYYPECVKVFTNMEHIFHTLVYIVGYIFQSLYLVVTTLYCHLVHVTSMIAIVNVEFELKLLTLSLLEMEGFINNYITANQTSHNAIKLYQNYFIRHHQYIYRKFNVVTRGVNWIALIFNALASLNICLSLYVIVQENQMTLKLQDTVFLSVWSYSIFVFDVCGERIKTENDKLRNALYESEWLEKPNWFKRHLLFTLTCSSKKFDIKPIGSYGFDFNSFTLTMKAAYCYYNVLCEFKQNNE